MKLRPRENCFFACSQKQFDFATEEVSFMDSYTALYMAAIWVIAVNKDVTRNAILEDNFSLQNVTINNSYNS